jgi:nicotinamidase-related amidase
VKKNILIVVDMQNDFIDGALGTSEAKMIVPNVVNKIHSYIKDDDIILVTRDTHNKDYLFTEEGKNLPVEHCIKGTKGHELNTDVSESLKEDSIIIDKPTFGSFELGLKLKELNEIFDIENIEVIGLCTDICVISNVVIAKSAIPNSHLVVDASCCAGVSPKSHNRALDSMQTLQIEIVNRGKEPWIK